MYKIGDFSRLANVTVKTLRHYDRLGLLRPMWIERYSGYRYYSIEQLPRLNRILTLKDLGFTLEQISKLIREDLTPAQLRAMLQQQRAELSRRVETEQQRLAKVEERLQQIEMEGKMSTYEVVIKKVEPQLLLTVRKVVPYAQEMPGVDQQLRQQLEQSAARAGLKPAGPRFTFFYNPQYTDRDLNLEMGIPVEPDGVEAAEDHLPEGVQVREWPGAEEMASVLHTGPIEEIHPAFVALHAWVTAHGYHISGPYREIDWTEPGETDPRKRVTEVQYPVTRVQAPREITGDREVRLEQVPAFLVIGQRYVGKNQNMEIPAMWGEFVTRFDEIDHIIPGATYGVGCGQVEGIPEGEFEYIAGIAVSKAERLPRGMVLRMVPEQLYAVFMHYGSFEGLRGTYNFIYEQWLPQSGYERTNGPELEVYRLGRFTNFAPDSEMEIYIPIKQQQ